MLPWVFWPRRVEKSSWYLCQCGMMMPLGETWRQICAPLTLPPTTSVQLLCYRCGEIVERFNASSKTFSQWAKQAYFYFSVLAWHCWRKLQTCMPGKCQTLEFLQKSIVLHSCEKAMNLTEWILSETKWNALSTLWNDTIKSIVCISSCAVQTVPSLWHDPSNKGKVEGTESDQCHNVPAKQKCNKHTNQTTQCTCGLVRNSSGIHRKEDWRWLCGSIWCKADLDTDVQMLLCERSTRRTNLIWKGTHPWRQTDLFGVRHVSFFTVIGAHFFTLSSEGHRSVEFGLRSWPPLVSRWRSTARAFIMDLTVHTQL